VETDVNILYVGQQKNMGIRGMRKVKKIAENGVKENTLVVIMIMRRSKNKYRRRRKRGL
jgi:hypothetical protein